VSDTFVAQVTRGLPPQFVINKRHQIFQRITSPVTPFVQHSRDFPGFIGGMFHILVQEYDYPAYQSIFLYR
jgi:hypothetical protein